jgi:lactobin A/cerein 7B family class IIb bacteriocin
MAQIQITNLKPSDFECMEELTEEELLQINGGSLPSVVAYLTLKAAELAVKAARKISSAA